MKRCPRCAHARRYRLGDGRYKCRRCGRRYSWTSVWDAIAVPARIKRELLRLFVARVPPYRVRHSGAVSQKTHERVNRLLRALCAVDLDPAGGATERIHGTRSGRYAHLYVAEACYRRAHREQALEPRLLKAMRGRSVQELRPLLAGPKPVGDARRPTFSGNGSDANLARKQRRRGRYA